jgi:hypothetical protein
LPTGKYTRTNVNMYFVDAEALVRALEGDRHAPPRTVAPTHPNSDASTGTSSKFEQDPPLPPVGSQDLRHDKQPMEGEFRFSGIQRERPKAAETRAPAGVRRARQTHTAPPAGLEQVLTAWRTLDLGEPDDRSLRALQNRHCEGATIEELLAAVEGAKHDEWLRKGGAKSPSAVLFASLASIKRFAAAGREHARLTDAAVRRRDTERRAARDQARARERAMPSPAENAELAAAARSRFIELTANIGVAAPRAEAGLPRRSGWASQRGAIPRASLDGRAAPEPG